MDTHAFKKAYGASRNGANAPIRHSLVRHFLYSDGVQECAEAGCYWLLDVLATEVTRSLFKTKDSTMCIVQVKVKDEAAHITGEFFDGDTSPYKRHVSYTDMPEGEWLFYISDDGDGRLTCILPSEY